MWISKSEWERLAARVSALEKACALSITETGDGEGECIVGCSDFPPYTYKSGLLINRVVELLCTILNVRFVHGVPDRIGDRVKHHIDV